MERHEPSWQSRSQVSNTHTEEVGRDRTNIPTELPQRDSFQGQQKTWETYLEAGEGIQVAVQENWVFIDILYALMSKRTVCKVYWLWTICLPVYTNVCVSICRYIKLKDICQVYIKLCWGGHALILPNLHSSVLRGHFLNIFSLIIWQNCTCMKSIFLI